MSRIHIKSQPSPRWLIPREIDLRIYFCVSLRESQHKRVYDVQFLTARAVHLWIRIANYFRLCTAHFPSQLNSHRGGATHLPLDTQLAFSQALNWVIRSCTVGIFKSAHRMYKNKYMMYTCSWLSRKSFFFSESKRKKQKEAPLSAAAFFLLIHTDWFFCPDDRVCYGAVTAPCTGCRGKILASWPLSIFNNKVLVLRNRGH